MHPFSIPWRGYRKGALGTNGLKKTLWGSRNFPAGIYLFKVNNGNIRRMCDIFKVNIKEIRTMSVTSFWSLDCSLENKNKLINVLGVFKVNP